MCRRNHLIGLAVLFFGLGLVVGHCLESAFLCIWGGVGLICFGLCMLKKI